MKTYRVYLQSPKLDANGDPVIKIEMNIEANHSGVAFDIASEMHPEMVVFDAVEVE